MRAPLVTALALILLTACGPGKYGYARTYAPLKAERDLYEEAVTPPYEDVVRDPVVYSERLIAWFGVVEAMEQLKTGEVRLTLSQRRHQGRHLCRERADTSCRVTVSNTSSGPFQIDAALTDEETEGQNRLWVGSLLRVYGTVDLEAENIEVPKLKVRYRRHWPRATYVTTAARATMRR